MKTYSPTTRQWMLAAIICGLGALAVYLVAAFISISMQANYLFFMTFGPFFSIAILSLYKYLKEERDSVLLQIGTVLMIIAGGINTIMASMQGALRIYFDNLPHDATVAETTQAAWKMGLHAGNALQLGIDVAWDVFVFAGLLLWGIVFMRQPRFNRLFGWTAMVLGLAGLVLNFWTFPSPPGEAGLIDVGPLVAVWFLVVSVQMIRILLKSRVSAPISDVAAGR